MYQRPRSWFSLVSFLIGITATVTVWNLLSPVFDGIAERARAGEEQRYLMQIQSLKQALEQSQVSLRHERKLAVGLQRELQDATRQIDDLNRGIERLRANGGDRRSPIARAPGKRASLETTSSFVVTYAARQLPSVQQKGAAAGSRDISPYAPRKRARAGQTRRPRIATVVKPTVSRTLRSAPARRDARVAALGRTETSPSPAPMVFDWSFGARTASLPEAGRGERFDRDVSQSPQLPGTSAVVRRVPKRRVRAARPRARAARYRPRQRLGRVSRAKRNSRRASNRRRGRSLFSRLARRGVFGDGYSAN